jgi:hypothetical protein
MLYFDTPAKPPNLSSICVISFPFVSPLGLAMSALDLRKTLAGNGDDESEELELETDSSELAIGFVRAGWRPSLPSKAASKTARATRQRVGDCRQAHAWQVRLLHVRSVMYAFIAVDRYKLDVLVAFLSMQVSTNQVLVKNIHTTPSN